MLYTNCWLIELVSSLQPVVYVERTEIQARTQFQMLISTVLSHGPKGSQLTLTRADAKGNLIPVAAVAFFDLISGDSQSG